MGKSQVGGATKKQTSTEQVTAKNFLILQRLFPCKSESTATETLSLSQSDIQAVPKV